MTAKLVVFCGVLGRHRAGMQHPPMAEYPTDHFSAAQLAELRRDPVFHLALGTVATSEALDTLMGQQFAREHAAAKDAAGAEADKAKKGAGTSKAGA